MSKSIHILSRKERIEYNRANIARIIAAKTAIKKEFVGIPGIVPIATTLKQTVKESVDGSIIVRASGATAYVHDSFDDVNLFGMWDRDLPDTRHRFKHLQEHQNTFENTISRGKDLKVFIETISWKELGFEFSGDTESLTIESKITEKRNELMFRMYNNGYVDQHSVGAFYGKILLALDDKDSPDEFKTWTQHIDRIVNKEHTKERGFFFALERCIPIEISAVPDGANPYTPTQSVSAKSMSDIIYENVEMRKQLQEYEDSKKKEFKSEESLASRLLKHLQTN